VFSPISFKVCSIIALLSLSSIDLAISFEAIIADTATICCLTSSAAFCFSSSASLLALSIILAASSLASSIIFCSL
jgi:hypothetical protein